MEDFEALEDIEMSEILGNSPDDFQTELLSRLDTIIENQSDISDQLHVVIEGQAAISKALYSILGLAILAVAFKLLWTAVAKWLFGGV